MWELLPAILIFIIYILVQTIIWKPNFNKKKYMKDISHMRCKNCKFFRLGSFTEKVSEDITAGILVSGKGENEYGHCLNEKIGSDFLSSFKKKELNIQPDGIYASCDEDRGMLEVGKEFGCIHWDYEKK